jgi:cytochrome bd-type quinol oxidase subunit 2
MVIRQEEATRRLWRAAALVLGVASIVVGLLLILIDGVDTSPSWVHHAGLSSAPLLLVAGALAVTSILDRPRGFRLAMRIITVTAFLAWGVSQLLPDSGVGTSLDDIAILLFVIDAGVFVVSHRLHGPELG